MNIIHKLFSLSCAGMLAGGCATTEKVMDASYGKYIDQERVYNAVRLVNVDEVTIRGQGMEIALEAPLNPLSVRAADPNVALQTIETLGRVAVAGAGIYQAGSVMKTMAQQPKTVDPVVVQPQVVEVPGATQFIPPVAP